MSDFGRSGSDDPSRGDWWRYGWLLALGSLVLLIVSSQFVGARVILLVICLAVLVGIGTALAVRRRSRR